MFLHVKLQKANHFGQHCAANRSAQCWPWLEQRPLTKARKPHGSSQVSRQTSLVRLSDRVEAATWRFRREGDRVPLPSRL